MRYTVRKSVIDVIGRIWMPATTAAMSYTLSDYDVGNIAQPITRDTVADWLNTHAGDFASVTDFSASLEVGNETIEFPWASEESEITFSDATYGSEDG